MLALLTTCLVGYAALSSGKVSLVTLGGGAEEATLGGRVDEVRGLVAESRDLDTGSLALTEHHSCFA